MKYLFATLAVLVQSLREVERYTKAADQTRLARNAMARAATVSPSRKQA